jgi:hypothetical protein
MVRAHLSSEMNTIRHFDIRTMLDNLEQRVSEAERDAFLRHLGECRSCREASSGWAGFLDTLTHPPLAGAPASARFRALGIFGAAAPERAPALRTLAALVSDTWAQPAAVGLRGDSDVRHLHLSAGRFELYIRLAYSERGPELRGQLLDSNGTIDGGFDVLVTDPSGLELDHTPADEFGEFAFEPVASGGRTVIVRLPDGRQIAWTLPMEENRP